MTNTNKNHVSVNKEIAENNYFIKAILCTIAVAIKKSNRNDYAFKWSYQQNWRYEWRFKVYRRNTRFAIEVRIEQGLVILGGQKRYDLADPRLEEKVASHVGEYFDIKHSRSSSLL